MLDALARVLDRRRRAVLVAAVVVVFAAGAFGGPVVGLLDTGDDFSDPQSESILARDTIERTTGRSAAPDAIVLVRLGAEAGTPAAKRKLDAVLRPDRGRRRRRACARRGARGRRRWCRRTAARSTCR